MRKIYFCLYLKRNELRVLTLPVTTTARADQHPLPELPKPGQGSSINCLSSAGDHGQHNIPENAMCAEILI